MIVTLNFAEKTNNQFGSQQDLCDMQTEGYQVQMWRTWYMKEALHAAPMPQSRPSVCNTPLRDIARRCIFSQDNAFEENLDAPCLQIRKEVMPLVLNTSKPFNLIVKFLTKNSTI